MNLADHILIPFRDNNLVRTLNSEGPQPWEFMYGAKELLEPPYSAMWFNVERGRRNRPAPFLLYPFEKWFSGQIGLGLPFELVLENRKKIRAAQTIFCNCDAISFAFLLGKKMGLVDGRVVTLFQSLSERYLKIFQENKKATRRVASLLAEADQILTLSEAAKAVLCKTFNVREEKVGVFRFGADTVFWEYVDIRRDKAFVLSVGNDMNRDYSCLLQSVEDQYPLTLVTEKRVKIGGNIVQKSGITNSALRRLYQTASVVVIPTRSLETESAGLSCVLQALACGAPVITAKNPALMEMLTDEENITFYEPGNAASLREKIEGLWGDADRAKRLSLAGRELVDTKFNSGRMTEQLVEVLGLSLAIEDGDRSDGLL